MNAGAGLLQEKTRALGHHPLNRAGHKPITAWERMGTERGQRRSGSMRFYTVLYVQPSPRPIAAYGEDAGRFSSLYNVRLFMYISFMYCSEHSVSSRSETRSSHNL